MNFGVRYADRGLRLTVTNPISPTAGVSTAAGGHGILGMRERASLLGGTLEARRDRDAFWVRARLPYSGEEAG